MPTRPLILAALLLAGCGAPDVATTAPAETAPVADFVRAHAADPAPGFVGTLFRRGRVVQVSGVVRGVSRDAKSVMIGSAGDPKGAELQAFVAEPLPPRFSALKPGDALTVRGLYYGPAYDGNGARSLEAVVFP